VGRHGQPRVVEVDTEGLVWVKSSTSSGDDNQCVEVAHDHDIVLIRDSRDRIGPRLSCDIAGWNALVTTL
jgi:hypothetical protein